MKTSISPAGASYGGYKLPCKLCRNLPPQQWGPDLPFFGASRPCGPAGWLVLLLIKAGDVETNPYFSLVYSAIGSALDFNFE